MISISVPNGTIKNYGRNDCLKSYHGLHDFNVWDWIIFRTPFTVSSTKMMVADSEGEKMFFSQDVNIDYYESHIEFYFWNMT